MACLKNESLYRLRPSGPPLRPLRAAGRFYVLLRTAGILELIWGEIRQEYTRPTRQPVILYCFDCMYSSLDIGNTQIQTCGNRCCSSRGTDGGRHPSCFVASPLSAGSSSAAPLVEGPGRSASSWDMLLHRQPTTLSGARFALAMALTPFELAMKSHDRNICDCGVLCVYTVLGNDACSHFWLQLLLN